MNSAFLLLCLLLLSFASCASPSNSQAAPQARFAHDVYFELKEDSAENRAALVDGCWKQLAHIEGIRSFAAGTREESLDRGVNDVGYDVSLHVLFDDMKSHDAYQVHPSHLEFVERFMHTWESVRVFDSQVLAR